MRGLNPARQRPSADLTCKNRLRSGRALVRHARSSPLSSPLIYKAATQGLASSIAGELRYAGFRCAKSLSPLNLKITNERIHASHLYAGGAKSTNLIQSQSKKSSHSGNGTKSLNLSSTVDLPRLSLPVVIWKNFGFSSSYYCL
jgi:hypothetical protein